MREGGHGDGGGDDDDDEESKGDAHALIQDIARFQGHCCHRTDRQSADVAGCHCSNFLSSPVAFFS